MKLPIFAIHAVSAAALCVNCACGNARENSQPTAPQYELTIVDEPTQLRFFLRLSSKDQRDLCIGWGAWPDREGKTQSGKNIYSLISERGTFFPHPPTVEADCWGADCVTRIKPRESLTGFISYSEFGDPNEIKALKKRELHVDIVPAVCESLYQ